MAIFLLPDFLRIYDMPNFLIGVVKQLLIYLTSFEYCEDYLKEDRLDMYPRNFQNSLIFDHELASMIQGITTSLSAIKKFTQFEAYYV